MTTKSKTDRGYTTRCFIWSGKLNNKGYGKVVLDARMQYAHRAMYEQEVGPIPEGLEIDHRCRNRACVNPSHLEPVLHPVNQRRGKNAKITEAQAEMIRNDSRSDAVIAREYGLDSSYVWRLKAGKRRRRLPAGTVIDVAPLPR